MQPPFNLRNSKWCSVSSLTLIEYSSDLQRLWSDCAYAQADLRLCWSHIQHCWKSHVAAQILLIILKIPSIYPDIEQKVQAVQVQMVSTWRNQLCWVSNKWLKKKSFKLRLHNWWQSLECQITETYYLLYIHWYPTVTLKSRVSNKLWLYNWWQSLECQITETYYLLYIHCYPTVTLKSRVSNKLWLHNWWQSLECQITETYYLLYIHCYPTVTLKSRVSNKLWLHNWLQSLECQITETYYLLYIHCYPTVTLKCQKAIALLKLDWPTLTLKTPRKNASENVVCCK